MRKYTNKIIDLVEDGVFSWKEVAERALDFMSEAEVEELYNSEFAWVCGEDDGGGEDEDDGGEE